CRRRVLEVTAGMARQALRVLAVAYGDRYGGPPPRELDEGWEERLVFVGLIGMIDPPRPEVRAALARARAAGVRTVVITGDHKDTALAIAGQLGIVGPDSGGRRAERAGPVVATGADLDQWSDGELARIVQQTSVFARVSPGHKLRIVKALRRQGEVV